MERIRKWAIAIQIVALLLVLGVVLLAPRPTREVSALPPPWSAPKLEQKAPSGVFSPLPLPKYEPRQRTEVRREVRVVEPRPELGDLSRFQRRLMLGTRLAKIHEDLRNPRVNLAAFGEDLESVRPDLLSVDRIETFSTDFGQCGRSCWETILGLWIKCRPATVKLSSQAGGDVLGRGTYIRVWTLGESYPRSEIGAAEKLIRHLESVAGMRIRNGFDVLATPRMGRDVFPLQRGYDWAIGTYFVRDQYAVVEKDLLPRLRKEVLEHELIHAFCHRLEEDFISSALVCEGLAEYLRFLEPGDEGLRVPPERMGNNFARLLQMVASVREKGLGIERLEPAKLLELSAPSFYAIHEIGYPIALAIMAYVGPKPIERAFLERSDAPIAEAIEATRWVDLMRYVEVHARDGDPRKEITVTDGEPQHDESLDPAETAGRIEETLEALGVPLYPGSPGGSRLLDFAAEKHVFDGETTRSLLEFLVAHGKILRFLVDRSEAIHDEFNLAESGSVLRQPFTREALRSSSSAGFIQNLHRAFRSRSESAVPVLSLKTAGALPSWLASASLDPSCEGFGLILCIAGKDEATRDEIRSKHGPLDETSMRLGLEEYYFDQLRITEDAVRAALVIDLSQGAGDALPLARALARTKGFRGLIGYWDPQKGE